jgi:hypothetical protein
MGFITTVSGYINVEGNVGAAVQRIEALPTYSEDTWPFLPREAFGLQIAKEVMQKGDLVISYKGECIIPFGMSVKQIDDDWEEWLQKFESLFKPMDATKAFVALLSEKGSFFYTWDCDSWRNPDPDKWKFTGEPRSFW